MSGEDDATKSHEPSRRKLENARRKGEVPRSQDISTAASYAGMVLAAAAVGAESLGMAASQMRTLIGQADRLAETFVTDAPHAALGTLVSRTVLAVSPFFILPALLAVAVLIVQKAFVFAPKKLEPKLSRISPLSNAKNKFGRNGLFEFAKSSLKLVIFSCLLGLFILRQLPVISASLQTGPKPVTLLFLDLGTRLLLFVLVIALSIGAIDYLWQWQEHLRKNRMSDRELRDEHKETEGDPHLKSERRARGQDIAMRRMIEAIEAYEVEGVATTLPFGKFVCQHDAFRSGNFDTHFVKQYYQPEMLEEAMNEEARVAAALAKKLWLAEHQAVELPEPAKAGWWEQRG